MVPCEEEEPCENGYLRDINGDCYCPTSAMEVINGKCTFKCPTGYKRNEHGYCVQIQNCSTDDAIINAIQASFENLWKASNASHTSLPMSSRLENGGWIVNGPNGYSFIPFPSTLISTPCGMEGQINPSDIPSNLVGMIHTHPFYIGENTKSVCGENGEDAYQGGPSPDDYETLLAIMNQTGNFTLKSYVIDGSNISSVNWSGASSLVKYSRCGY